MDACTVGIDIGTTSVKAVAADADGGVLARARVPHQLRVPAPDRLEHDANAAWRRGVRRALERVLAGLSSGPPVAAVNVAAMVPSLCAVDRRGIARTPGLLYGDARGGGSSGASPAESGELLGFLRWCAKEVPAAVGYWPAQAVANAALSGEGVIDSVSAMTAFPVFDGTAWDGTVLAEAGVDPSRLPRVVGGGDAAGRVDAVEGMDGALLGGGAIDAFAEQLVAGADHDGDVLVICGATLITWLVVPDWIEAPGIWTIPHTAPGKTLIGGPSNAGGLFQNWVASLLGRAGRDLGGLDPAGVPVWEPYVRGERTPLHDPHRRAAVHDLDLRQGPAALRRAAYEAAGFVVRHHLDLAGHPARRIVATGGGTRDGHWMQALADGTGLPVDVVAVPEGGALGSAFLARVTAGLEASGNDAARWAATDRRVEPDPDWVGPVAERYQRFRVLAGGPA